MVNGIPSQRVTDPRFLTEHLPGADMVPEYGRLCLPERVKQCSYRSGDVLESGSEQAAHPVTLILSSVISTEDQPSLEIQ